MEVHPKQTKHVTVTSKTLRDDEQNAFIPLMRAKQQSARGQARGQTRGQTRGRVRGRVRVQRVLCGVVVTLFLRLTGEHALNPLGATRRDQLTLRLTG